MTTHIHPSPAKPRFYVERTERTSGRIDYDVYEVDGATWTDGSPRPAITVELWLPSEYLGTEQPRLSWPSTSDKRPELAEALALALIQASGEAQRLAIPA